MRGFHEARRSLFADVGKVVCAVVAIGLWGGALTGLVAALVAWIAHAEDPLDGGAWLILPVYAFLTLVVTWGLDEVFAGRPRLRAVRVVPSALSVAVVGALAAVGPPGPARHTHGTQITLDVATVVFLLAFVASVRSCRRRREAPPRATAMRRGRRPEDVDDGISGA